VAEIKSSPVGSHEVAIAQLSWSAAGRGQPTHTRVITPGGWRSFGDIRAGDYVFNAQGLPTRVSAVVERGLVEALSVSFGDGTVVQCTAGQPWRIQSPDRRSRGRPPRFLCIEAIARSLRGAHGESRHYVIAPKPLAIEGREFQVQPYLLGALIGDGGMSKKQVYFATADSEMITRIRPLLPSGVFLRQRTGYWWHLAAAGPGRRNPLIGALRDLGLQGHRAEAKFIPEPYLFSSKSQRTALLQGLMDTDGSASTTKPPVFSTVSLRLVIDMSELVRSLGGVVHAHWGVGNVFPICTLSMRLADDVLPFALTRKADRYVDKLRRPLRMARPIRRVDSLGLLPCRTLITEGSDHTYLTDHFTVMVDAHSGGECGQSKYKQTMGSCVHVVRRTPHA
jgi:hypothetical protein